MPHFLFELRRYRLRPGARETLIDLFEREFVETQEVLGIGLAGQFRDADDPDAFVWLRSFANMEARAEALAAFYNGPVWKEYGDAANATMVNSDNVLLLKAIGPSAFSSNPRREELGDERPCEGILVATTCSLAPKGANAFAAYFNSDVRPLLETLGARIEATFVTEENANTFPRLPVREGEPVFVWFAGFTSEASYQSFQVRLRQSSQWTNEVFPHLDGLMWRKAEISRLFPTARSLYRW